LLQGPACADVMLRSETAITKAAVTFTTSSPSWSAKSVPAALSPGRAADGGGRKDFIPVVLHADHDPALLLRLIVDGFGERADVAVRQALGRAVGVFARGVVVQQQHHQPRAGPGVGPFQHLAIAG